MVGIGSYCAVNRIKLDVFIRTGVAEFTTAHDVCRQLRLRLFAAVSLLLAD